jgi:hypothetical protein
MQRSQLKWGMFDGKLAFNRELIVGSVIKASGLFVPSRRLMGAISEEVLVCSDDGLNDLREMLIRFRVAASAAPLMGQAGVAYYNMYTNEAQRREYDMPSFSENVSMNERPAAGRGISVEDNNG